MIRRFAGAAVLAAIVWGGPAAARADDDCGTWFPDFQCDRSGRFEGFQMPIVQPYLFEDPFNVTNLNAVYIWHEFPNESVLAGGDLHVVALQARVALTERIGLVATKDGYGWLRPDNPLVGDHEGYFNLGLGAKVVLAEDREAGWIVSHVLRFEAPIGSEAVFQGWGGGQVLPSLAAAFSAGDFRFIGDFGAQVPFNSTEQATSLFYHLYGAYDLHPNFQPFVQLSGISWIDDGNGAVPVPLTGAASLPLAPVQTALGTGPFEGADVANLGSPEIDGDNLFTWAVGVHVPFAEHWAFSAAYERSFGSYAGTLFEQRVTTSLRLEF